MDAPAGPTSTFSLVERFRSGDADSFRELFEKHQRRLAVLIHYKLDPGCAVEVDDILQETFFAASRDIARFDYRGPGSFFRWLAAIATHMIVDALRHNRRLKRGGGARVTSTLEPIDSLTPSRILFQHERVRAMMDRLDTLPPQYREVILLAKVEGLETAEIAARLGESRETIALRLHRALKRFREGAAQS